MEAGVLWDWRGCGGLTRGFWAVFEGRSGDLFCPSRKAGFRNPTHDDEAVMHPATG